MWRPSMSLARSHGLALMIFVGCTVDLGKLRGPNPRDGESGSDLARDTWGGSVDTAARPDERVSPDVPTVDRSVREDQGLDRTVVLDAAPDQLAAGGRGGGGGSGAAGGTGGRTSMGGNLDDGGYAGAGGNGGTRADGGPDAPSDTPGATSAEAGADRPPAIAEDAGDARAAPDGASVDRAADSMTRGHDAEEKGDALTIDAPDTAPDAPETDGKASADGPAAGDARADALSPDASGTVTCPTTINGSLDPTDLTQIGRLDRLAPASSCGTTKAFPGNASDPTLGHLSDVYHFVNPSSLPACFNFTLTYPGDQLYAVAYTTFQPTNLAAGYLGDVGGVLTSPQTMSITVNAGSTIDLVVYAIAPGTAAAGSYTLSCSTP
jgi:hypothetical protein